MWSIIKALLLRLWASVVEWVSSAAARTAWDEASESEQQMKQAEADAGESYQKAVKASDDLKTLEEQAEEILRKGGEK